MRSGRSKVWRCGSPQPLGGSAPVQSPPPLFVTPFDEHPFFPLTHRFSYGYFIYSYLHIALCPIPYQGSGP